MTVTILGCGIAGSWTAHHLALMGCETFVLFDGGANRNHVLDKGPYFNKSVLADTASETLANHLSTMNNVAQIEFHPHFEPNNDQKKLKGVIAGVMGGPAMCRTAQMASADIGLPFVSLGLPSTTKGQATITENIDELDPNEHFSETIMTVEQLYSITAEYAKNILQRHSALTS